MCVIGKIDVKDKVVYEDFHINQLHESDFHNLEKTIVIDGTVDFKALTFGNKLLDMKVTDVNDGIQYGKIVILLSKVCKALNFIPSCGTLN